LAGKAHFASLFLNFVERYAGSMSQALNSNNENSITPLAITNYRDIRKVFGIKQKNRRGHMYIIGKTGTGKSTLISNMVISDIRDGKGVALIDPHGDLVEQVLDCIPEARIKDVLYFDPGDTDYPIAFNPLGKVSPDLHHLVASGLIGVFKKIWLEFWGPRLEHILRHSLLTLLENPGSTLLDVPRLLTQKGFRDKVLRNVKSQQVREFWLFEFEKYSAHFRQEAISPILNKISQFLVSSPVRNIIGQKQSTFRFRKLMDEGKVLLFNFSKGRIGEDNSAFLGSIIVAQIQLAAQSRTNIAEENRRYFYLYVDEVHNFLTLSFSDILSESRKYGLNLVLAHQYMEQLDERIRAAIFGNVGTLISFRVGAEDAKYLAREFHPIFHETDFMNLPNYQIYLKLMIDGRSSQPFSAVTLPPLPMETSFKDLIIEASRKTYGKSRKEVERHILFGEHPESHATPSQHNLFSFHKPETK
jgi:hypothetical protein